MVQIDRRSIFLQYGFRFTIFVSVFQGVPKHFPSCWTYLARASSGATGRILRLGRFAASSLALPQPSGA